MHMKVDQRCPSCGSNVRRSVTIKRQTGLRSGQLFDVEWECPECACPFEQEALMDMEQVSEFGFDSWTGLFEGEPICLIVEDGAEFVDEGGESYV